MAHSSFPSRYKTLGEVISPFSQVLVINLDRRKDRWGLISAHLLQQGVKHVERISGIDGRLESEALCKRVYRFESEPKEGVTLRQQGVLGCLKSHLKALKVASGILIHEKDQILILEDDAFFVEGAAQFLEAGLKALPRSWDVFMLGAIYNNAPGCIPASSKVVRVWDASATHAYMVNKNSCPLLMHHIERVLQSSLILPVDELFIRLQPKHEFYAVNPLIAGQRSNDLSDIPGSELFHTQQCFKLGVEITWKVRLWMMTRPYLVMAKDYVIEYGCWIKQHCCRCLHKKNVKRPVL